MKPFHIVYCIVPEFGLTSLAVGIDLLRVANRMAGRQVFNWTVLSVDGAPVRSSCGLDLGVDGSVPSHMQGTAGRLDPDLIFCVAAFSPEIYCSPQLLRWLRAQRRRGAAIGGISSGTYLLAAAGLLEGRSCTIHWEHQPLLAERFPGARLLAQLCVIEGDIYTCGGSSSVYDLMLHLIEQQTDGATAARVAEQSMLSRIRQPNEPSRRPFGPQTISASEATTRAVQIMEGRISEPISIDTLARELGQSQRQLERIFMRELGLSPAAYYRRLRVERASQLLRDTELSVTEVGIACGFRSSAHFSRCYRGEVGTPPGMARRNQRRQRGAVAKAF